MTEYYEPCPFCNSVTRLQVKGLIDREAAQRHCENSKHWALEDKSEAPWVVMPEHLAIAARMSGVTDVTHDERSDRAHFWHADIIEWRKEHGYDF